MVFIDTAGLREGTDEIEVEGIKRSRTSLERAELILHVLDNSEPLTDVRCQLPARIRSQETHHRPQQSGSAPPAWSCLRLAAPVVEVSCTTGAGWKHSRTRSNRSSGPGEIRADMLQVMINSRHQDALRRAREATANTIAAFADGQTLEIAAMELRIATNAIGEVVGKTTTEDLLDVDLQPVLFGEISHRIDGFSVPVNQRPT